MGPRVAALPGLGWGVALLVALAAAGGMTLSARHADTDRTVDELVSSHVRADLSARDIDVISTDRHTVKPWFNGRIDYAPPVEDLAAAGFALVGGRLDYVGRRRVAVLVYRYRQHVIDVYVRPAGRGRGAVHDRVARLRARPLGGGRNDLVGRDRRRTVGARGVQDRARCATRRDTHRVTAAGGGLPPGARFCSDPDREMRRRTPGLPGFAPSSL